MRKTLCQKLKGPVTDQARAALEREFACPLPDDTAAGIGEEIHRIVAECQFNQLVKFMTGRDRTITPADEKNAPGLVRCLALVYQGVDAVKKIRAIVGTTDPGKAEVATVRKEFGRDIMINAAHASDSPENARREIKIINFEEDDVGPLITNFLKRGK